MICENFAYILGKKADYYPDDTAIVEGHTKRRFTYAELNGRVNRLANGLSGLGLAKGDRVACLTRNTVEYILIFFAAARLGAIVVPLNYRLSIYERMRILQDATPKIMIFDSIFRDDVTRLRGNPGSIRKFLVYGEERCEWAEGIDAIEARCSPDSPPIADYAEDPLLLLYTAGSTGRPKGVPLTHRNFFFRSVDCIVDLGFTRQDRTLTVLPLFHIGGHILYTLPHLHVGARIVLYPQFDAEATLRLIQEEKITNTFLLPTMIKLLTKVPQWESYDLSSLRFMGAGGEAVPSFTNWAIPICNAYGLTETTDGTTFLRPEHVSQKPANCIGKTHTSVDAKVVDANGNDLPANMEGEMLHRGPSVSSSYWNSDEHTAQAFRDGWLHTSDRVRKDADGFYYFLGRTDDMIISGGENIFPAELEGVIFTHPKVADVVVVGVADEQWGQVAKAVIVPKDSMTITEEEILSHVKQYLASFKKPKFIEFVSDLPKLGVGKVDRKKIKEIYGRSQT